MTEVGVLITLAAVGAAVIGGLLGWLFAHWTDPARRRKASR